MSGFSRSGISCPPASRPRWGRSRPGSARSTCTRSKPGPTPARRTAESYTPTDLRTIQDWIVRPQLRTVPGVNEVNTVGGFEKQFHVLPDPAQLMAYKLELSRRHDGAGRQQRAMSAPATSSATASNISSARPDRSASIDEIKDIVIGSRNGVPVRVSDVAEVREGTDLRTGAATLNGNEVVLGTAMLLIGENSRTVAQRVAAKLKEIGTFAAGRRDRAYRLRPHPPGRRDDRDRREESRSKARCW